MAAGLVDHDVVVVLVAAAALAVLVVAVEEQQRTVDVDHCYLLAAEEAVY